MDKGFDFFDLLDSSQQKKWFEEPFYTNFQFFPNTCKSIKYKKGRGMYTVGELSSIFSGQFDSVTLSPNLPESLIVYGRTGNNIDRDNEFYIHTKNAINPNTSKTLFINYTGHCGPVAAALCENGITNLIWNLKLDTDSIAEQRILGQLQDYSQSLMISERKDSDNIGLLLEPAHGFDQTIDYYKLPSVGIFQRMGIDHVVILVEKPFDETCSVEDIETLKDEYFKEYIKSFIDAHISVSVVGVNEGKTKEPSPDKELIESPEVYSSNFTNAKKL